MAMPELRASTACAPVSELSQRLCRKRSCSTSLHDLECAAAYSHWNSICHWKMAQRCRWLAEMCTSSVSLSSQINAGHSAQSPLQLCCLLPADAISTLVHECLAESGDCDDFTRDGTCKEAPTVRNSASEITCACHDDEYAADQLLQFSQSTLPLRHGTSIACKSGTQWHPRSHIDVSQSCLSIAGSCR